MPCLFDDRPARDGGLTCWQCVDSLQELVADIAEGFVKLDPRPGNGGLQARRAPGFRSQAPGDVHVMALRDRRTRPRFLGEPHSAAALLPDWANAVRLARGQTEAQGEAVGEAAAYLVVSMDWMSRQPWIEDFRREAKIVLGQVRRANGHPNPRPQASCTAEADDLTECGGPLFAPREGERLVECPRCGTTYDLIQILASTLEGAPDAAVDRPTARPG